MIYGFGIVIGKDLATPAVRRVLNGLQGSTNLAQYGGRKVQSEIGTHVLAYAGSHHRTAQSLGASPTGFYSDAYEQVTAPGAVEVTPGQAILKLPRNAFSRAFHDVNIVPGAGKKYLTFAAVGFAYGRRAGSFGDLIFGMATDPESGKLRKALVQKGDPTHAPVYWLVRQAHQKQDRNILPSDNQMAAAALEGAAEYVDQLIQAKGGN